MKKRTRPFHCVGFNHPLLLIKIYCFKFVRYSPTSKAICFCLGTEGTTQTLIFVQKILRVERVLGLLHLSECAYFRYSFIHHILFVTEGTN